MKQVEGNATAAQSRCAPAAKSKWLSSRNVLIGAAVLAGGGALLFGWDWLAAAGLASIIIGALPCLVMCALGICASRMDRKQSSSAGASDESSAASLTQANHAESESAKRAA